MIRNLILILGLALVSVSDVSSQDKKLDSLGISLADSKNYAERIAQLHHRFYQYLWSFPDSALIYVQQEKSIAEQTKSDSLLVIAFFDFGWYYCILGRYIEALDSYQKALRLSQASNDFLDIAQAYEGLETFYYFEGDYERALQFAYLGKNLLEKHWSLNVNKISNWRAATVYGAILNGLAANYTMIGRLDSALFFANALNDAYTKVMGKMWSANAYIFGDIYFKMGDYQKALEYYRMGAILALQAQNRKDLMDNCNGKAKTFKKMGWADSAIYYAKEVVYQSNYARYPHAKVEALDLLAEQFMVKENTDSALKYLGAAINLRDTLLNKEKLMQIESLTFNEQQRQKEIEAAKSKYENQVRTLSLVGALVVLSLITFFLWRNNRHKQRANILLHEQKKETDKQKQKVEQILDELRSTQSELIESEQQKMRVHHDKELLSLEARALRAQMNPHFIYNCMNSIKVLIQNDDKRRSIEYLTTFSKLIRMIFQNSDKRQISLYDEIETCRLYTQLEAMRLNGKLQYDFCIDQNLDLKSVMVPALIVQPFIENAIWHGIVPNDGGTIKVSVKGNDQTMICEVDDNGIGRERSKLNRPTALVIHESKGVHLSQRRLNLEKTLNDTNATIDIVDKYEGNISTGTRVILTFNLN